MPFKTKVICWAMNITFFSGSHSELCIMLLQISVKDKLICLLDGGNSGQPHFLDEAILLSSMWTFCTTLCLRRVGLVNSDAKFIVGSFELRYFSWSLLFTLTLNTLPWSTYTDCGMPCISTYFRNPVMRFYLDSLGANIIKGIVLVASPFSRFPGLPWSHKAHPAFVRQKSAQTQQFGHQTSRCSF